MESSRGGPLTTFIMMLPLIVVPAIAMLKPADLKEGWVSRLLSASETSDVTVSGADDTGFASPADEFDALFGDQTSRSTASDDPEDLDAELFREAAGTAISEDFSSSVPPRSAAAPESAVHHSFGPVSNQAATTDLATRQLLAQLEEMGATRTLWFSPGEQTVGFVAFFPSNGGMVSYRFESMAHSQEAAIHDVMQQIVAWKGNSGR